MSTVQVWTCGRFIVAETAWLEDIGDGKTHLYNFCTGDVEWKPKREQILIAFIAILKILCDLIR